MMLKRLLHLQSVNIGSWLPNQSDVRGSSMKFAAPTFPNDDLG